jgi:hypothetical protein
VLQEVAFNADVDPKNYIIQKENGTLIVNPKATVVTISAASLTQIYDGLPKSVLVITDPSENPCNPGEALNLVVFFNELTDSPVRAGIYEVRAVINEQNYVGETEGILELNISGRSLTPSFAAENKTYDGNTMATVLSTNLDGVVEGDIVSVFIDEANFEDKNAGTNKMVTATGLLLGGDDAENYTLSQDFAITTADIFALELMPVITANSKIYDGNTIATVSSTNIVQPITGDDIYLVVDENEVHFDDQNAGTGKVVTATGLTLNGADQSNYVLSQSFAETFADIEPKALYLSTSDFTKLYGEEDPEFALVVDGLIGTDAITGSLTRAQGEDVAFYAILPGTLDAGLNYELYFDGGYLEITQRSIIVTADNKSKISGEMDPSLTYSITGGSLAFSDFLSGDLQREPGESINYPYQILQGSLGVYNNGSNVSSNYVIDFIPGIFTINYPASGVKKVRNYLDCVEFDGSFYYARFRYENDNPYEIYIPANGPENYFIGDGVIDGSQLPNIFFPGSGEFVIKFDGTKVVWVLASYESEFKTAVSSEASSGSGRCGYSEARLSGYSDDLSKDLTGQSDNIVSIYPNPTKDRFMIGFSDSFEPVKELTLFDVQGRAYTIRPVAVPSLNALEIDISVLSRGLYILKINNISDDRIFRIIKE